MNDKTDPSENPAVVFADILSQINPDWVPDAWQKLAEWERYCDGKVPAEGEEPGRES